VSYNKYIIIFIFLLSGLLIYLNLTFDVIHFNNNYAQILYSVLLLGFLISRIATGKVLQNLKHLAIWAGIFLVMMTGYSYRHELSGVKDKVMAEFIPAKGFQNTPTSISFPISSDGHFYIQASVNGVKIKFLADTGASKIVLSPADAARLGLKLTELKFDRVFETANGRVRGSSIRIADFRVSKIHLTNIGAFVNEAAMKHSLLGMTFFKRLERYEVQGDVLTLYFIME
jgi:aspartyl protease family protein